MIEINSNGKINKGCCNDFMAGKMNFQEMFEKMGKCCPEMFDSTDCSTMMKQMKEMFCGTKTKGNNTTESERRKC
jgi:hypothetical protein